MRVHVYVYIHIHIYTHIGTHVYTRIHIYMPSSNFNVQGWGLLNQLSNNWIARARQAGAP